MTTPQIRTGGQHDDLDTLVGAAMAGDEVAFDALVRRHQRELRTHCYRMLGSYPDAEDLVQETFTRAWAKRSTYEDRSSVRAWLYRIATNACLDFLRAQRRRPQPAAPGSPAEICWLTPYPGASPEEGPESAAEDEASLALVYLTAIQRLPPRQRAVLILRQILEWPAAEAAETLGTSVEAVNSSLQRAMATLRSVRVPGEPALPEPKAPTASERRLVDAYVTAHHRQDLDAVVRLMHADVRFTMPPQPGCLDGRRAVVELFAETFADPTFGRFRLVPLTANGQWAAANYRLQPGDDRYRAMSFDVLRFAGSAIAEITTFEPDCFGWFGLPDTLRMSGDR